MAAALEEHDALLDAVVLDHGGTLVKKKGEGDSTFSVFDDPGAAAAAAIAAQLRLQEGSLRVRMAIHTGAADTRGGDYYGPTVNRCARLRGAAHGGQVIVSNAVAELVRAGLPSGATLLDLGVHRLRDLAEPEHVHQLCHPWLPREFPPLASLDVRRDNIRPALTSFVGRRRELDELAGAIGAARLVTLVGPGGAGKTRLAVEVGRRVGERFADGVWVAELASIDSGGDAAVASVVADALGVREQPGLPLADALAAELDRKSLLLILDNCEHVVDGAAAIATAALAGRRGTVVLASSRQPLQLRGEQVWPVAPLSLPTDDLIQDDSEAVALFVERATRIDPHFTLDARERDAVTRICRAVDGLPLGIELAAARIDTLSAPQIADRLDRVTNDDGDRYDVLAVATRNTADRQRTLANTIAWSYDLLDIEERDAFAALAVFPSTFDIGGAEAVVGGRTLPALTALVTKSLVGRADQRYVMLETIRAFAADKLAGSGRAGDVHDRFTAWATGVAATDDIETLDTERENLLSALQWATARQPAAALTIAAGLGLLWEHRGYGSEGLRLLERVLAATDQEKTATRARVLAAAGHLAANAGDLDRAKRLHDASAELAEAVGDTTRQRDALNDLGRLAHLNGNVDAARSHFEAALTSARRESDPAGEATALGNLAILEHAAGQLDDALRLNGDAVALARQAGDNAELARLLDNRAQALAAAGRIREARVALDDSLSLTASSGSARHRAVVLYRLGALASADADIDEARRALNEAAELFRSLADRLQLANVLYELGTVETKQKNFDDARKLLDESLGLFADARHPLGEGALLVALAELDRLVGDDDGALLLARRGLATLHRVHSSEGIVEALDVIAALAASRHDVEMAARLVGAADDLRDAIGVPRPRGGERSVDVAAVEAELGARFAAVVAEGAGLDRDAAVDLALGYTILR